jgi:hypothetical protein
MRIRIRTTDKKSEVHLERVWRGCLRILWRTVMPSGSLAYPGNMNLSAIKKRNLVNIPVIYKKMCQFLENIPTIIIFRSKTEV